MIGPCVGPFVVPRRPYTGGVSSPAPLVLRVDTWLDNQRVFDIPITAADATIDWGDGNIDAVTGNNPQHTYAVNGKYTITVTGDYDALTNFDTTAAPNMLTEIVQWGVGPRTGVYFAAFKGAINLVSVPTVSPPNAINIDSMFEGCPLLDVDTSAWDTSTVITARNTFNNCPTLVGTGLDTLDLSGLSGSNSLDGFAGGTTYLSTAAYDAMLIAWASGVSGSGWITTASLNAGQSRNTPGGAAAAALQALVTAGWTATDGGEAHVPQWVVSGTGTGLTYPTDTSAVSDQVTFVAHVRIDDVASQQYLLDVWGRDSISVNGGNNKLVIVFENNAGDTELVRWQSKGDFPFFHQRGLLHVAIDLAAATPTITVKWDGIDLLGDVITLVQGGQMDLGRNGYGVLCDRSGANPVHGEADRVLLFDTIEPLSTFWDEKRLRIKNFQNADMVNTPLLNFGGGAAGWNAGTSGGTWADFTAVGTFVDADLEPMLVPRKRVGHGDATTGGDGGKVVIVDNHSDDALVAGSFPWALQQHVGQAIEIYLRAEGLYNVLNDFDIDRDDVTIDGQYAPGEGWNFWNRRLRVSGSNIILRNFGHYGNSDEIPADPASDRRDCIVVGSADGSGTAITENVYLENLVLRNGQDEIMAFYCRTAGEATGNIVRNVTMINCVVGDNLNDGHRLAIIVGDGCEKVSILNNLILNIEGRTPYVKTHAADVEFINNAVYNFGPNAAQIQDGATVDIRDNLFRLGPESATLNPMINIEGSGTQPVYLDGNVVDSPFGIGHAGLSVSGTAASTSQIASSDYHARKGDMIAAYFTDDRIGPQKYGGGARTGAFNSVLSFIRGNQTEYDDYPGWVPTPAGASFPANTNGIPDAYLVDFPTHTDLETVLATGPHAGKTVAAHLADWFEQRAA